MNALIPAAEIWVPDADGYLLEFAAGAYGDAIEFDATSRALCFGRGEGLPGRVWEDERPMLLENLDAPHFRRAKAAANAGYRAAIGIPYRVENRIAAIVVLFFGDVAAARSAVELWRIDGTERTAVARLGASMQATDGTRLSLPIGSGSPSFELTLAGHPSEPIGTAVTRWRRDQAPDASPAGAAAAAVFANGMPSLDRRGGAEGPCTLALPIVVGEVVTDAVTIAL